MPKLETNELISHHPNNKSSIIFYEGPHTYIDDKGKIYESGTTFVGKYFEKFNAAAVAEKCSKGNNPKYAGRSSKEIQEEWAKAGDLSSEEGTNIHLYFEGLMSDWPVDDLPDPLTHRCELYFKQAEIVAVELKKYYVFIGAEVIIFSIRFGKSGMIDLLLWSRASNIMFIFDLKTNKEMTYTNKWKNAFEPISHLQDTKIAKYSLQLSLYQRILETEGYFPTVKGYERALIHLREDGFDIIPIEYYDYEIDTLFAYEGF